MTRLRVGACQTPEYLGDPEAALVSIEDFASRADVDVLLFPECFLQGYLVTAAHVETYALDLSSLTAIRRRLRSWPRCRCSPPASWSPTSRRVVTITRRAPHRDGGSRRRRLPTMSSAPLAPRRFAALRNPDCRPYLFGAGLSMMADNIEHVITYWVLWQTFESSALAGFQVISHWIPFLLFSVYFGALADRFDCRRVIQAAQALFMVVSLTWGILWITDSLQIWQACVLLVLHGVAGSLWGPGEQLMLHDFVGSEDLPSAVRLNATFRSLGVLFGPVIGSALLLGIGPIAGIWMNVAFYLPLTLFLFRTRFTGHTRDGGVPRARVGLAASIRVLREVGGNRVLVSMIILAGLASFFVGASLQSVMPIFAEDLGAGSAGAAYAILLFANGMGGVIGGILLEVTGRIRPTVASAVVSTAVYGLSILVFAVTSNYPLAVLMLLIGGVANLASMSVGQTVVQLQAPAADRGRVIGTYGMSAHGLRTGSGFTVGLLGAAVGVHWSLGISAAILCLGTAAAAFYTLRVP